MEAVSGVSLHPCTVTGPNLRDQMEQHPFGSSTFQVYVIGQGTWHLDSRDRATAMAALRRDLDLGMTHIDTAEMYGSAEDIVGEAIAGRRDEMFLPPPSASKLLRKRRCIVKP